MRKLLGSLRRNCSGVTAVEYGLITALISVAILVAASTTGSEIAEAFGNISTELSTNIDSE